MKKLSGSDWLIVALLAIMVIGVVCAALVLIPRETGPAPGEGETPVTDHNWELPEQCSVVKGADGAEKVLMTAQTSAAAWNAAETLEETWSVSARIHMLERSGDGDCARILFGDAYGNIGMVVGLEYQKNNCVQLRVDMMRYLGWRTLYTTEKWVGISEDIPVELTAELDPKERILKVTLSQEGMVLMEAVTDKVPERVLEMIQRVGVGVYDSYASFSVAVNG